MRIKPAYALLLYILIMLFCAAFAAAEEHRFGDWEIQRPATCSTSGLMVRSCQDSGCKEQQTRTTDTLPHDYGVMEVRSTASCEQEGSHIQTCGVCGQELTFTTPVQPHAWSAWSIVNCQTGGISRRVCANCPAQQQETKAPRSHDFWPESVLEPAT